MVTCCSSSGNGPANSTSGHRKNFGDLLNADVSLAPRDRLTDDHHSANTRTDKL